MTIAPVTRYTRARRDGTLVRCPECAALQTVYHFAWSALKCESCSAEVKKENWWSVRPYG